MASIEQVIEEKAPSLMEIAGVVGIGQGMTAAGKECVLVMVTHSYPETEGEVRSVLAGYPFEIEVTGEFQAGPL